jgi:hypothetical protein
MVMEKTVGAFVRLGRKSLPTTGRQAAGPAIKIVLALDVSIDNLIR